MLESVELAVNSDGADVKPKGAKLAAPVPAASPAAATCAPSATTAPRKRKADVPAVTPTRTVAVKQRKRAVCSPGPPSPLSPSNARGRAVLVLASTWPDHTCQEHNGVGWSARVLVTWCIAGTFSSRQGGM